MTLPLLLDILPHMSTTTYIKLLNSNDPKFMTARDGSPEDKESWEDYYGPIENMPGAEIECDNFYEETDEEYGGWIIDLSKIPKEATHIKINRY